MGNLYDNNIYPPLNRKTRVNKGRYNRKYSHSGLWLKRLQMVIKISNPQSTWLITKKSQSTENEVGLLVDGPNILRKVNGRQVKLENIKDAVAQLGKIIIAKVYLDINAPTKLVQAVTNSGFEPVVVTYDIHITLAVDAYHLIYDNYIQVLAIASRHARCAPLLRKVKEKGIKTVILGFDPGFAVALKNSADFVFELFPEERETTQVQGTNARALEG